MNRRTCLPCFVVAVTTLAGLGGCSSSKPSGSETTTKAPFKLDKIQGKVQIQLQPSSSEAGLNSGGPSVFLWVGVRRYRLFFKTLTEVSPGEQYAAEGIWAQRVIDEIGDLDQGKNGYPLEASCARVVKMAWPGQSFDLADAQASSLKSSIKRYPARPVFLVTKITPLEGAAKDAKKEEKLPEVAVPADKQKATLLEGSAVNPAPLWVPEGGNAKCNIVIGTDGKVAELQSGAQLCEAVPWNGFRYQPAVRNGRPVKVSTEVEVRFEPKK